MVRVGILLASSPSSRSAVSAHHGPVASAWIASLLERMQQDGIATLALVAFYGSASQEKPGLFSRRRWSQAAFRFYQQWDQRRFDPATDALAPVPLPAFPAVPVLAIPYLQGSSCDTLRGYDLDLLLCPEPIFVPALASAARHGMLVLDSAQTLNQPEMPPVWWEHTHNEVAITRLVHLADPDQTPRVLYETQSAMDPYSFASSRNPVYWKSVEIILRSLQRLDREGPAMLEALPPLPSAPARGGSLGMGRFLQSELRRRVNARRPSSSQAGFAEWCIGLRPRREEAQFDSPDHYCLMLSPQDRFYADPFLFEHEGRTWLFFEDFRYAENRAVISCCELDVKGEPGKPFEVLRLPFHLSYPFVFAHEGTIYMIPESRGNRTVTLYRATAFPHSWQLDTDLFSNVHMVDTTLHHDGETWWMFAAVSNGRYSNSDELCLYFADALRGPWTPHPQNPVLSDVRRARPAGRIFEQDGRLLRPSQDCGPAYGYGLVFSEIEELTRECYRERVLRELTPESVPGNTANHTYNRTAHWETIDRVMVKARLGEVRTFSSAWASNEAAPKRPSAEAAALPS